MLEGYLDQFRWNNLLNNHWAIVNTYICANGCDQENSYVGALHCTWLNCLFRRLVETNLIQVITIFYIGFNHFFPESLYVTSIGNTDKIIHQLLQTNHASHSLFGRKKKLLLFLLSFFYAFTWCLANESNLFSILLVCLCSRTPMFMFRWEYL